MAGWRASKISENGVGNARKRLTSVSAIGSLNFIFAVVLFPAFFGPLFSGFHVISIGKMRAERLEAFEDF